MFGGFRALQGYPAERGGELFSSLSRRYNSGVDKEILGYYSYNVKGFIDLCDKYFFNT
jgi:hypothetical protein